MVNISNCYVCLLNFYIYCFILIELILKVNVDELCWNWLNYMLLLRNGELVMNVDKVIVMWFVIEKWWIEVNMNDLFDNWLILCIVVEKLWIWYMMSRGLVFWVMLMNCFEIDWLCMIVENDVNVVYVELKIEILRYVDD